MENKNIIDRQLDGRSQFLLNKHAELKEMLEIEEKQMEKCERERNEFDEQF